MAITLNGTTGISSPGGDTSTSLATTNLSYTGTLTGGTGVIAIGTNQIYKDASGNTGFGTTSPQTKIHVVGSLRHQNATDGNDTLKFVNASGGLLADLYGFGTSYFTIQTGANIPLICNSQGASGYHRWQVNSSDVMRLGKATTLALEGASTVSGTGITFPATQSASSDANTLDDYEEGTWSSTVSPAGNLSSPTLSSGTYTKVGRLVVLSGSISGTVTSANASLYAIFNLPFVSAFSSDWNAGVATNLNGTCVPGQIIDNTNTNQNTAGMYLPSAAVPSSGSQSYSFTYSYFAAT